MNWLLYVLWIKGLVSLFCKWISSHPCPIYLKEQICAYWGWELGVGRPCRGTWGWSGRQADPRWCVRGAVGWTGRFISLLIVFILSQWHLKPQHLKLWICLSCTFTPVSCGCCNKWSTWDHMKYPDNRIVFSHSFEARSLRRVIMSWDQGILCPERMALPASSSFSVSRRPGLVATSLQPPPVFTSPPPGQER